MTERRKLLVCLICCFFLVVTGLSAQTLEVIGADLSVEQARKRAEEMNGAIAMGVNPAAKRRTVRDEMTLGELFETFLNSYAKEHKKSWKDDVGVFNLHLNAWRLRKISSIRKVDVVALHSRIGRTRGQYSANRVVELLCAIFNRARNDWNWQGENPAASVKAFKERKRERFLQGEELPAFFQSLAKELNETVRDYVLVSLLTGARRANVQEMRWQEISWTRGTWTIPGEQAKSDETMSIALSPVVLRILENRKATSTREWVFAGNGRTGHLVEPELERPPPRIDGFGLPPGHLDAPALHRARCFQGSNH